MLKKIKSHYIIKCIFENIEENIKMELIKYDKSLQNKIEISLLNYKILSGKYLIYENNEGKGKEYNGYNDKLLFEGKYLNGKRNGEGYEYNDKGKLIFAGLYLNGKRNGKGYEYNDKGKLIFEGEYLNGKKLNGKRYDGKNNCIYEIKKGEGLINAHNPLEKILLFKKVYSNGKVRKKYILDDELIYENEGNTLNGKRLNEKGKEYKHGKEIFEGEYKNGEKWNGKVKEYDYYDSLLFEGEYKNGKRNGIGKEYYFNALLFEGEYLNGKKNGNGKEYNFAGQLIFEGEYYYDHKIRGKEYYHNDLLIIDNKDKILEYEGEYLYDKKWNGKGYDKKGNLIYELKNGTGKVKEFDRHGHLIFEGEFKNGKKWNGKGKEYDYDGELLYEGEFKKKKKKELKLKRKLCKLLFN